MVTDMLADIKVAPAPDRRGDCRGGYDIDIAVPQRDGPATDEPAQDSATLAARVSGSAARDDTTTRRRDDIAGLPLHPVTATGN